MRDVTGSPGHARNRGAGRGVGACLREQSKLLLAATQEAAHQVLTSGKWGGVRLRRSAGQGRTRQGTGQGDAKGDAKAQRQGGAAVV